MNMFAMSILVSTIACLIWGAILGMIRGRNRSILRLVIIVISVVLSIVLKNTLVETIMGLEIDGQTLKDSLMAELASGDTAAMGDFMGSLIEIIFGLLSYLVIFAVLELVTWIIVFPICKIFVKKDKGKKKVGTGAIIGLVQGLLIAFVTCAPLTGMLVSTERIMAIIPEMDQSSSESVSGGVLSVDGEISTFDANGEKFALAFEEEIIDGGSGSQNSEEEMMAMFEGFADSPITKVYTSIGGWYYDIVASVKVDGVTIHLDDYVDVVDIFSSLMNELEDVQSDIDYLANYEIDNYNGRADLLKEIGTSLKNISSKQDALDEGGRRLMDAFAELVIEMSGDIDEETQEMLEKLTGESFNLTAVGNALITLGNYAESIGQDLDTYYRSDTPYLNEQQIANIVDAISENVLFKGMLGTNKIIEVGTLEQKDFNNYIEENFAEEEQQTLKDMFGLN